MAKPLRKPGSFENREKFRRELFDRQRGLCHLCGFPMSLVRGKGSKVGRTFATFDHVVPASKGGHAVRSNLKLAHMRCNSRRGHAPLPDIADVGPQMGVGLAASQQSSGEANER